MATAILCETGRQAGLNVILFKAQALTLRRGRNTFNRCGGYRRTMASGERSTS
ncbi:MAG: hypothetical protein ACTS47_02275 [Candidatus Hodgkinia cicadicola]